MDHDEILGNRACLAGQQVQESEAECCGNYLVFAMQDRHHSFSLGITTLLQCLQMAEREGGVPDLPAEWWYAVLERYNLTLHR